MSWLRDPSQLVRLTFGFKRAALGGVLASLGIVVCLFAAFAGARADQARGLPDAHATVDALPAPTTAHIETWAFDDGCNGGVGASRPLVRQWVTIAESQCGPKTTKARRDCHSSGTSYCYVMQYLDTDWNFGVEGVHIHRAADAGWWLHEPARHRVRIFSNSFGGGHLLNQGNPAVRSFFQSYARRHYNSDDGLLLDWQAPSLAQELYYATCGCRTTSEIRSDRALRTGHEQMSAALTRGSGAPFIQVDNALPSNPFLPQGLDLLNPSTGVYGLAAEGEPENYGTLDPYYSTLMDQIAYVATRTAGFVVTMSRAAAGASNQLRSRRVQEATMLLGYSPGHLVDWADLETGSRHLAVWPEEGIYPTAPVQSMSTPGGRGCLAGKGKVCSRGGHNDLRVARGVYRREFGACYLRGILFGACAAIVNTTGRRVTVRSSWLRGAYGHRIKFRGGDVQSRGTIDLTGARFVAGVTRVASRDAVLLAP